MIKMTDKKQTIPRRASHKIKTDKNRVYVVLAWDKDTLNLLREKLRSVNIQTGEYFFQILSTRTKIGKMLLDNFNKKFEAVNK